MNTNLLILLLAFIALIILFLRVRKKRVARCKLERDATGFWRYHKETVFERKVAFGRKLKGESKPKTEGKKKPIAVLNFLGDVRAKQHKSFSKLVDEVVVNKEELEEVVVVVNSPGGMVAQYGHAFSQMERLRETGLRLTACVDVVAASGGYLMALPAHKILAAPFAIVGSIGVMAFVPNIRKMLLGWNINPRTFTAGKYKRTVSLTDDASEEEVARFQEQLESVHGLFLSALKSYRPNADVDSVGTGEHWTARESLERGLNLVDEIKTSHDYLLSANTNHDLVVLSQKKSFLEDGFGAFAASMVDQLAGRFSATHGLS